MSPKQKQRRDATSTPAGTDRQGPRAQIITPAKSQEATGGCVLAIETEATEATKDTQITQTGDS